MRGHLAAQIDPLNLNYKTRQEAKKLVIRSVEVQDSDMDNVYQLPETTWIGGSVSEFIYLGHLFLPVLDGIVANIFGVVCFFKRHSF